MALHYAGSKNQDEFWNTLTSNAIRTGPISKERLGVIKKDMHFVDSRPKYADTFNNDKYGTIDVTGIEELENLDNEHDLLLKLAHDALGDMERRRAAAGKTTPGPSVDRKRTGIVSGCLSFPSDRLQGELLNLYQAHLESRLPAKAGGLNVFSGTPDADNNPWSTAREARVSWCPFFFVFVCCSRWD